MSLIDNPRPLQPEYIPSSVSSRDEEYQTLTQLLDTVHLPNILLHGPRGTGKTLLTRKLITDLQNNINHHYVDCSKHHTEYQTLKRLYRSINQREIGSGFHTSKLKREIQKQTQHTRHVIVLDEADFLLQNDGNSVLYYLSRLKEPGNTSIITVSAHTSSLQNRIDERTYSTLQPQRIGLEPYTPEQAYEIIADRARQALEPTSLHHEALTYLASTTQNLRRGLHWLQYTARKQTEPITEEHLRRTKQESFESLVDHTLSKHSKHHQLLYNAIKSFEDHPVNSGQVYTRYREHCQNKGNEPLSNRRISDFIQHLELHSLIESETYRGGKKGKTREISPTKL